MSDTLWHLKGEPYEVQERAIQNAIRCSQSATGGGVRGFGFCMEMGLGKTATALNDWIHFGEMAREQYGEVDLIILCPNSLKSMWKEQLSTWLQDEQKEGMKLYIAPMYPKYYPLKRKVLILNYESLSVGGRVGVKQIENFYRQTEGLVHIILDESTQIKNYKAKRTKMLHRLIDNCWQEGKLHRCTILSGNPTPNGLDELWAQLYPINGVKGIGYHSFKNLFCKMGGYQGKKVIGINTETKDYFDRLVGERVFFALKKDWTDLPDKHYILRKGEMGEIQKQKYNQMAEEMVTYIEERAIDPDNIPFVDASWILVQMGKLMQLSSGFIIDTHAKPERITYDFEDPKLDMLKEDLQEIHGKTIVVVQFKHTFQKVLELTEGMGLQPAVIGGGMTTDELDEQKAKFNNDSNCRVIICQCSSAKFGHTLLGDQPLGGVENESILERNDACTNTIFYENNFSYEARSQMEDRNHRLGQKRKVTYTDYQLSPMDLRVREALLEKSNVHKSLVKKLKTTPEALFV